MSAPIAAAPIEPDPATQDSEPLAAVGVLTTVGGAAIAVLVAFGLPISGAARAALLSLLVAVAPLVTALVGRTRVYSPKTVAALLAKARSSPPPPVPPIALPPLG